MKRSVYHSCVSLIAITSMAAFAAPAFAQTAAAAATTPADAPEDTDAFDTIVVTASTGNRTQLNTSASISAVNSGEIKNFNATSTAELIRLIPGFQVAGTQGDGGNSNIGVRGLRTPTGGSPFVQIQEDGLPTVLFGDIQFGNNDYFTRADPSTERLESIRGGTASTLASQAVGGVLNFISYTGRNDGGFVELEKGVNYDATRVNARIGGSLNDSTYYNIGGSFNVGRGELHAAFNVSNSYVVKGNITKELADNRGYVRLLFKLADTQEPSYNGCVSSATLTGKTVSNIGPSAFCDGRKQTADYSVLNQSYTRINPGGVPETVPVQGITTNQKYLQLQAHYDLGGGITIDDNARVARISDNFNVQFYGAGPTAGAVGAGQSLI